MTSAPNNIKIVSCKLGESNWDTDSIKRCCHHSKLSAAPNAKTLNLIWTHQGGDSSLGNVQNKKKKQSQPIGGKRFQNRGIALAEIISLGVVPFLVNGQLVESQDPQCLPDHEVATQIYSVYSQHSNLWQNKNARPLLPNLVNKWLKLLNCVSCKINSYHHIMYVCVYIYVYVYIHTF